MSDKLQARIALLNYYASLMQGYKTSILTLVVAILTLFEIWSRILSGQPRFSDVDVNLVNMVLSLIWGALLSSILVFIIRFLWCGQIVTSAIRVHSGSARLQSLEKSIKQYATNRKSRKEAKKTMSLSDNAESRLWRLLMDIGDCKGQLVLLWGALAMILGFVIFRVFPLLLGTRG